MAHEDPGDYDVSTPVDVEVVTEPPTVTILVQHNERAGRWILKCCPPPSMSLPNITARGESLSEAVQALADLVMEWEDDTEDFDGEDGAFEDDD